MTPQLIVAIATLVTAVTGLIALFRKQRARRKAARPGGTPPPGGQP